MDSWEILALLISQIILQLILHLKTKKQHDSLRSGLKTMETSANPARDDQLAQAIHTLASRIGNFEARLNLSRKYKTRTNEKKCSNESHEYETGHSDWECISGRKKRARKSSTLTQNDEETPEENEEKAAYIT